MIEANQHPLLGKHKHHSNWYTPTHIWTKIKATFNTGIIYDPCPIYGLEDVEAGKLHDGLDSTYWHLDNIYINPPSPASKWAIEALKHYQENSHKSIMFAAYSEAVLFQQPELKRHLTCWVRNRIKWDSNTPEKVSPRSYNAFILMTNNDKMKNRFYDNFHDMGDVGYFYPMYRI